MNRLGKTFLIASTAVAMFVNFGCSPEKIPAYGDHVAKNKKRTAETQIELLDNALTNYRLDVGSYPDSLQALVENIADDEKWRGPYLQPASIPKDPWNNDFVYVSPGKDDREYEIVCCGPDGELGTKDDITNYTNE